MTEETRRARKLWLREAVSKALACTAVLLRKVLDPWTMVYTMLGQGVVLRGKIRWLSLCLSLPKPREKSTRVHHSSISKAVWRTRAEFKNFTQSWKTTISKSFYRNWR